MKTPWISLTTMIVLLATLSQTAVAQPAVLRPIALTGTDGAFGPGLSPGVFFSSFDTAKETFATPAINRVGDAIFMARLGGPGINAANDTGIWVERNGQLSLLARTGDPAPGTAPGVTFASFHRQPILGASGQAAFMAVIAGPGVDNTNNDGLWTEGSGSLDLLLREQTTPVPGGSPFEFGDPLKPGDPNPTMWIGLPLINANGRVLMTVLLTGPSPLFGYYTDRFGSLEQAVSIGDDVPGLAPRTFAGLGPGPGFSDSDAVTFYGITTTPFPQFSGIWTDRTGSIASAAITGDPAPGTGGQIASTSIFPASNSSDRIALTASITTGSGTGVFSEGLFGVLQPIAIGGAVAPGTSKTFFSFDDPVLGDDGTTAFVATINVFSANRGVWSNRTGILQLVTRAGLSVPGVPGSTFVDFFDLAINATGETSFFSTTSTGQVLCRQAPDGVLSTVVSEFTLLDVLGDGSDVRLITDLFKPTQLFTNEPVVSSTGDGRRIAFSDGGDVVCRLKFSDASEGIFTTTTLPPNPFSDLGNGSAGTHGMPILTGEGSLLGGDPVSLTLTNALENTTAHLIIGFSNLSAPFKGGVMVPNPDVLLIGLPTGPTGEVLLASTWPVGLPSGFISYYQHWINDPLGPRGFAASNALSGTVP